MSDRKKSAIVMVDKKRDFFYDVIAIETQFQLL